MSKKITIVISIILFIILCVLIICEKKWPEAGSDILLGASEHITGNVMC